MRAGSLDEHEFRYVMTMWRGLRSIYRFMTGGALALLLLSLGGMALLAVNLEDRPTLRLVGLVATIVLAVAAVIGLRFFVPLARQKPPRNVQAKEVAGRFRWDDDGSGPQCWIGDATVSVPQRWRPLIDQTQVVVARAVPGPDGELIVLGIGDRFSVSSDVASGLLWLEGGRLAIWFSVLPLGLFVSGVVCAFVGPDPRLLLQVVAGRHHHAYASVRALLSQPPPDGAPVALAGVVVGVARNKGLFALDEPPELAEAELLETSQRLRDEAARLRRPVPTLLPRLCRLLRSSDRVARQFEETGRTQGLAIESEQLTRNLKQPWTNDDYRDCYLEDNERLPEQMVRLLDGYRPALGALVAALHDRRTVTGTMRRRGGAPVLDCDWKPSVLQLIPQAVFAAFALGLVWLLVQLIRRKGARPAGQ